MAKKNGISKLARFSPREKGEHPSSQSRKLSGQRNSKIQNSVDRFRKGFRINHWNARFRRDEKARAAIPKKAKCL